jgi:hypothetical protein
MVGKKSITSVAGRESAALQQAAQTESQTTHPRLNPHATNLDALVRCRRLLRHTLPHSAPK